MLFFYICRLPLYLLFFAKTPFHRHLVNNDEKLSLADYLDKKVFAGNTGVEIAPTAEDVAGFDAYIETYKAGLAIEQAAVANKK